jgi:hypothetical protein
VTGLQTFQTRLLDELAALVHRYMKVLANSRLVDQEPEMRAMATGPEVESVSRFEAQRLACCRQLLA